MHLENKPSKLMFFPSIYSTLVNLLGFLLSQKLNSQGKSKSVSLLQSINYPNRIVEQQSQLKKELENLSLKSSCKLPVKMETHKKQWDLLPPPGSSQGLLQHAPAAKFQVHLAVDRWFIPRYNYRVSSIQGGAGFLHPITKN